MSKFMFVFSIVSNNQTSSHFEFISLSLFLATNMGQDGAMQTINFLHNFYLKVEDLKHYRKI